MAAELPNASSLLQCLDEFIEAALFEQYNVFLITYLKEFFPCKFMVSSKRTELKSVGELC